MESPRFENQSDAEDYIRKLENKLKLKTINCKYCHISYGIGISGKTEEIKIHCEYDPEIDYKELLK